jgi:carbamate kinase
MTQGELGSLIASAVNALRGPGAAVAVVTHVTVSPADPAFAAPSKPIGPFFSADEARRLSAARGWVVHQDSGRGFRRVVPSPEPIGIVEIGAIRALVDAGCLVIACGGGGIPVASGGPAGAPGAPVGAAGEHVVGIDAVIDKDRAASLVARLLGAQALVLVTAVDNVMINYGTPQQAELGSITTEEAERHLRDGQFPPGSMGPKIEAALSFLAGGGEWAAVTSPGLVAATLSGEAWAGTRIERSPARVVQGR